MKAVGERFVKGSSGGPDAEARPQSGSHIVAIAYDSGGARAGRGAPDRRRRLHVHRSHARLGRRAGRRGRAPGDRARSGRSTASAWWRSPTAAAGPASRRREGRRRLRARSQPERAALELTRPPGGGWRCWSRAALLALVAGVAVGAGGDEDAATRASAPRQPSRRRSQAVDRLSLRQQVGQLTISSFGQARCPAYIRRRLRAGETAGVILFGFNGGHAAAQWRRSRARCSARPRRRAGHGRPGGRRDPYGRLGRARRRPAASGRARRVRARRARAAARSCAAAGREREPRSGRRRARRPRRVLARARSRATPRRSPTARGASIEGMGGAAWPRPPSTSPGLGRAQVNTDDGSTAIGGDARRRPRSVPRRDRGTACRS